MGKWQRSLQYPLECHLPKLNENATKLIVTPSVHLRVHTPENHGGVEYVNGKEKKIEVPKKEAKSKDIVLDDIVIDLKK